MPKRSRRIGEILVAHNLITQDQLQFALEEQKKTKEYLGLIILRLGYVTREEVDAVIAEQLEVDYCRLKDKDIPAEVIAKIPAKIVNHYHVMPVSIDREILVVAMVNPLDINVIDDLEMLVKMQIHSVYSNSKDIEEAIHKYYGLGAETIETMMGASSAPALAKFKEAERIDEIGSEASIGAFLNKIILRAYEDQATDIHIEPFEDELNIRYRIDGILYEAQVPSDLKHFRDALNSRIKVMANLDIAEKRLPQDGRVKVRVGDTDLDLRVAFIPTPYGQGVVIRILNSLKLLNLSELGLSDDDQSVLTEFINKPNGVIFVTGPTGSGKTTTLYGCLSQLNTQERKLITIEDPVEYQLRGITQIQINPSIGLSFAMGLRSMLRFDPDVMMVGEVRDIETARITMQASLTGHLVFSTLHTNDAAGGVARLIDMGVEPYLITSAVECFIAQRLIRCICSYCKQPAEITDDVLSDLGISREELGEAKIFEGTGCEHCRQTGYLGRQAIYEFLVMSEPVKKIILAGASSGEIKAKAVEGGMSTLMDQGLQAVLRGVTTMKEVLRVVKEDA